MKHLISQFKFSVWGSVALILLSFCGEGIAQDKPLAVKLLGGFEFQNETYKASEARGFALGGQFNYRISGHFDINVRIDYEQMNLTQNGVLYEWEWDYWEDTYVDFLPGITAEELNATLAYTSTDSIYSATFEPTQTLKELKFSAGMEYKVMHWRGIKPYVGLNFGMSLFYRELKMTEHWIKRFKLDTLTTSRFDYEYTYDLTHFAPTREGQKIFAEPVLGARINLTASLDFDMSYRFIHYFDRADIEWLEDLLNISEAGQRWYPLQTKSKFMIGITFKY